MKGLLFVMFMFLHVFALAQAGSEIYLFDLKFDNGKLILSNGANITNHKGYDNQPYFHPSKPVIYYSSFNDSGRSDIKFYNYETKETANLTQTREREYSPTVTPDTGFISCIIQRDNGAQDLAKIPINGGKPHVLVWHLKVGYHTWARPDKVFMFVLDDSTHFSLHNYDLGNNMDTVIAEDIGRSLHRIPDEDAVSYLQRLANRRFVIKKYVLATGVSSPIVNMLPGQEFFCWVQPNANTVHKRYIISTDGSKVLFHEDNSYVEFKDKTWEPAIIEGESKMLKNITRMAVNQDNTRVAIVVAE